MFKILLRAGFIIVITALTVVSFILCGVQNETIFYFGLGTGFLAIILFSVMLNMIFGKKKKEVLEELPPEDSANAEEAAISESGKKES